MTRKQIVHAATAITAFVAIVLAGMLFTSPRVRADNGNHNNYGNDIFEAIVAQGLTIAPVVLRYTPTDSERELVGLGSYLVNALGDCNGCHNSPDLGGEYVEPTGDPFLLKPPQIKPKVNPAGYLGGGTDFGPYPGPGPWGNGPFPHIVSRNLTPDFTGKPEGGHSLNDFKTILRTGHDFDNLHPTCAGGFAMPVLDGTCIPAPFDGSVLQIMPWQTFSNLTDFDIQAIYEYLKAIPCISHAGTPGLPANIYNTCN
jgi:hypothetical protein